MKNQYAEEGVDGIISSQELTPNGIVKKWCRQRDLETKLAMLFANAQLPLNLLHNPFFRDFLQTAQPKFSIPQNENFLEEIKKFSKID